MLIKCPECQEQTSDQAAACPHCGLPIKVVKKGEPWWIWVLIIGIIAYAVITYYGNMNNLATLEQIRQGITSNADKIPMPPMQ